MALQRLAFVRLSVPCGIQLGCDRNQTAAKQPRQILTFTTSAAFLGSTAFLPVRRGPQNRGSKSVPPFPFLIRCRNDKGKHESPEPKPEGQSFVNKFDPHSNTDAFGRDPRKETEFWKGAAKNVLDSDEVKDAIAKHAADGADGLSDEQRAYLEFIKSLDAEKAEDK